MSRSRARRLAPLAQLALLALLALLVSACETSPPQALRVLRVGTSGDYPPFSSWPLAAPGPEGFDIELIRAFAAERGYRLTFSRFRWPELSEDLRRGRFDVAMSGVTVRPERSAAGIFSLPVVAGGAVALVNEPARFADLDALDAEEVRIAVNRGGHLERVTRAFFPRAEILLEDNATVPDALAAGRADAAVSDVFEAPLWLRRLPRARALPVFTRDLKACWVHPEQPELAAELDAWLLAAEAEGSLSRLRRRHLGPQHDAPVAAPLPALLAALDERLSLMPLVAQSKHGRGLPLRVPQREAQVLDAAVEATRAAAERAGRAPPAESAVRQLFAAQIAAARQVQSAALANAPASAPPPSLEHALRPALLHIGERIARLLVALPSPLDAAELRAQTLDALSTPGLSRASADAIADALVELTSR